MVEHGAASSGWLCWRGKEGRLDLDFLLRCERCKDEDVLGMRLQRGWIYNVLDRWMTGELGLGFLAMQ
jgi:hypothetical protein